MTHRFELLVRLWAVLGTQFTVHCVGPNEFAPKFGVSVTEETSSDIPDSTADGIEMTIRMRRIFCVLAATLNETVTKALHRTVEFIKQNEEWTNQGPRAEKIDELLMLLVPDPETRH